MNYTFFTEPDLQVENTVLLSGLFSDDTMAKTLDSVLERFGGGGRDDELRGLLFETVEMERYVSENINYNIPGLTFTGREAAEFLYKIREEVNSFPAYAFCFYEQLKAAGITDKVSSILIYIDEEKLSSQLGKTMNWPRYENDAEIFARINSCEINSELKFEALQLYYRFDEYYEYYQALSAQAIHLMKEKLYLFKEKLERFEREVGGILAGDSNAYLKERWGVEFNGDDSPLDIMPAVYIANGIRFTDMLSSKSHSKIHWGVSIIALTDIMDSIRPPAANLPDFLKAVSDNTKWSILQLLKKEPLYGGQLAEQLGLTGATISHHMDALKKLDLILYRKESTKLYYSLNEEIIEMYLKALKKELTGR